MPRDTLQLHAGYNLFRKGWLYNYKFQIWFKKNKEIDKWIYFNPLEWKKNEYTFGQVDQQNFLPEEDAKSYMKQFDDECKKANKKKQGLKGNNNTNSGQVNNTGNNNQ